MAFTGLFLLAHAGLPALFGRHAPVVSLVFLVLAPALAAGACLIRSRDGHAQGWRALAIALMLWAGGMAVNVLMQLALGNSSGETALSMLLFVLYGVPVIFIAASPAQEAWPVRLVDATLALALGLIFYVHTFAFANLAGSDHAGEANLRLMFDIENLFIAIFALIRFASSGMPQEKAFFRTLTAFASLYMASAAYVNHFQANTDYGTPVDLVIDAPFLALMMMALRPGPLAGIASPLSARRARIVLASSPLMLPAMLLAVAAALLASHPFWAVTGFAMATLVYGLRNVLAHIGNLEERDRLEGLAQRDGLTGLPNRRCFDETFQREWARARRAGTSMAVLMIDIDHFKLLNDALGHAEGDRRLRDVAEALAACATRATDMVARYGGEEFVAILPAVSADQAVELAEIMRVAVERLDLPSPAPAGRVTVSIGIGQIDRVDETPPDALLRAADKALYEAKRAGRNALRLHRAEAQQNETHSRACV